MTPKNLYEGVQKVIYVSTSISERCEHCDEMFGGRDDFFAASVNHHIERHGYKLLHVGGETSRDQDGNPWLSTVAVLGK